MTIKTWIFKASFLKRELMLNAILLFIALPAETFCGAIQFFPNFIDDCPNHDPVLFHGVDKMPSIFNPNPKKQFFTFDLYSVFKKSFPSNLSRICPMTWIVLN